jgi:hypothetical protein
LTSASYVGVARVFDALQLLHELFRDEQIVCCSKYRRWIKDWQRRQSAKSKYKDRGRGDYQNFSITLIEEVRVPNI